MQVDIDIMEQMDFEEISAPLVMQKLKGVRRNSAELGPCEVCASHGSEMFLMVLAEPFEHDGETKFAERSYTFGHEKCLREFYEQVRNIPAAQAMESINLMRQRQHG